MGIFYRVLILIMISIQNISERKYSIRDKNMAETHKVSPLVNTLRTGDADLRF